ncbi:hypothetical protein MCEGE14_03148 [Burkholderiaceae bacterium]
MEQENIILTGIPRSGTTLTCHLLNKLPQAVALHEPMNVNQFSKLESREVICQEIRQFFQEARASISFRKEVLSKNILGAVPDNPVGETRTQSGLRQSISPLGLIKVKKELDPGFLLVIKHPAAFTALLRELVLFFPCYAVIRNPLSVLASWSSVAMPVENGHAPAAEGLDAELRQALACIGDKTARQLHLLSWFYEQYQRYIPVNRILRYEDLISSGGANLQTITPIAQALCEPLASRNSNPLYDQRTLQSIGKRLLATEGAYWQFYTRESVELLCR